MRTTSLLLVAVLPCIGCAQTDLSSAAMRVQQGDAKVVCPALLLEEPEKPNGPTGDEKLPISLIVLGTGRSLGKAKGYDTGELQIDHVIYGSVLGKTVRFNHYWDAVGDKPAIFALSPSVYEDGYDLHYVVDSGELDAERAKAAARLDFNVLSSACIFVGREFDASDEAYLHTVEVVRGIYGTRLDPGQKVTVRIDGYGRRSDREPVVHGEEMIYLVSSTIRGRGIHDMPKGRDEETVCELTTRLLADQEQTVREALARWDSYPVTEIDEGGLKRPVQEILFRGTSAQAIDLMGSSSDAAVALAERKLIVDRAAATKDVFAVLERDLLKQKADDPRTYRRLRNLIYLLVSLDENHAGGEAGRLVDRWIAHIAGQPIEAPPPAREDTHWEREGERTDVNHSLAWLLKTLPWHDDLVRVGEKAIRLRDGLKGEWRREVQIALDAAGVEDAIELNAALARSKEAKPRRIAPVCGVATRGGLAFSHDGKLLVAGATIWNVADWSKAGSFTNIGSVYEEFFSPDDRYIYVLNGWGASAGFRLDWRTGKREDICVGHRGGVTSASMSADGTRMVTASYYDGSVRLWDLPSCRELKVFDLPRNSFDATTLSPDGELLVRQTGRKELTVESLADGKSSRIEIHDGELEGFDFTPDGKYLIVPTYDSSETRLIVFNVADGFKREEGRGFTMEGFNGLVVTPDSRCLVAADQDGSAQVLSIPDLRNIKSLPDGFDGNMAFSPDGALLLVRNSERETARLFDGRTFDPIQPAIGHSGSVRKVCFSDDGGTLVSIGRDNNVCRWETATGKMLSRFALPRGYQAVSARRDGRYLVCYDSKLWEDGSRHDHEQMSAAKIVDSSTGKVVSELLLPVGSHGWTWVDFIDDHRAVVATGTDLRVFDYLTGRIERDIHVDCDDLAHGRGEIVEDGKSIFVIEIPGKGSRLGARLFDIRTGQAKEVGERDQSYIGSWDGLVPGGKHFYVADPGIHIFDRTTLDLVAAKEFEIPDIFQIDFARDGSRYVVTGGRTDIDVNFRRDESKTTSILRIQETLTGKTVWAALAPTLRMWDLAFSPDGRRVAAVDSEGAIVLWDVGK